VLCYCCQQRLPLKCKWRGFDFCDACWSAERSKLVPIKKRPSATEDIEREVEDMKNNPAEWRIKTIGIAAATSPQNRIKARDGALEFLDRCREVVSDEIGQHSLLDWVGHTLRQYVVRKESDGMARDVAELDFDIEHDDQRRSKRFKPMVNSRNEKLVYIEEQPRVRMSSGWSERTVDRSRMCDPQMVQQQAHNRPFVAPLTDANLVQHDRNVHNDAVSDSSAMSAPIVPPEPSTATKSVEPATDPLQFPPEFHADSRGDWLLVFKDKFMACCVEMLDKCKSDHHGWVSSLQTMYDDLVQREQELHDLPFVHSDIKQSFEQLSKRLEDIQSQIPPVKSKVGLEPLRVALVAVRTDLASLEIQGRQQANAMSYKRSKVSSAMRADYMARRWQIERVKQALVHGTFLPKTARFCAVKVVELQEASASTVNAGDSFFKAKTPVGLDQGPERWDPSQAQVWTGGHTAWAGEQANFEKLQAAIDMKMSALAAVLRQNPNWSGAWGNVSGLKLSQPDHAMGTFEHAESDNMDWWLMCCRRNRKRHGPQGIHMDGFGCLYYVVDHDVTLLLTPMDKMLQQGIAGPDMEAFLETKQGQALLESHAVVMKVPAKHWAWVPWGFQTHCIALYISKTAGRKRERDTDEIFHNVLVLPLITEKVRGLLDQSVVGAIKSTLGPFLYRKAPTMPMWQQRKDLFDAILGSVQLPALPASDAS